MASHTSLDRGNSSYRRSAGIRMTVLTGNLKITCVYFVAKSDGLRRERWLTGKGQPDPESYRKEKKERNPGQPPFHSKLFLTEAAYISN
jgi:hypothetical protein